MKITLTVMFTLFLLLMLAGHLYYILVFAPKSGLRIRRRSLRERLTEKPFIREQRRAYIDACMIRQRRLPDALESSLEDILSQIRDSSSSIGGLSSNLAEKRRGKKALTSCKRAATRKLQGELEKLGRMPEIEDFGAQGPHETTNPNLWFRLKPLGLSHGGRVYEFITGRLVLYIDGFPFKAYGESADPLKHPAVNGNAEVIMRPDVNSAISKLLAQNELFTALQVFLKYMQIYEQEFSVWPSPEHAGMVEKTAETAAAF